MSALKITCCTRSEIVCVSVQPASSPSSITTTSLNVFASSCSCISAVVEPMSITRIDGLTNFHPIDEALDENPRIDLLPRDAN